MPPLVHMEAARTTCLLLAVVWCVQSLGTIVYHCGVLSGFGLFLNRQVFSSKQMQCSDIASRRTQAGRWNSCSQLTLNHRQLFTVLLTATRGIRVQRRPPREMPSRGRNAAFGATHAKHFPTFVTKSRRRRRRRPRFLFPLTPAQASAIATHRQRRHIHTSPSLRRSFQNPGKHISLIPSHRSFHAFPPPIHLINVPTRHPSCCTCPTLLFQTTINTLVPDA